jgi:streptogramin lyase
MNSGVAPQSFWPVRRKAASCVIVLVAASTGWCLAGTGGITGVVSARDGAILDGVTVSARADGSGITTSVYTDVHGMYILPQLPPGHYRVWAQAIGYARADTRVNTPSKQALNLHLDVLTDPEQKLRQLPTDVLLQALPQSSALDKEMVRMLRSTCSDCHTPGYALQQRFDLNGWRSVLNVMERISIDGTYRGDHAQAQPDLAAHKEQLAQFLTRIRGPSAGGPHWPIPPRPSGDVTAVVFREYAIPVDADVDPHADFAANDGTNWSDGMPSQLIPGYQPHDAVADLQGNLWFTNPVPSHQATFGRIDGKTGEVKLFKLPGHAGFLATTHGLTRDRAGNLWTGPSKDHGVLVKIDPRTQEMQTFTPPAATGMSISLDSGPDGKIWMSSVNGVMSYDPSKKLFVHYSVGTANKKGDYDPTFSYGVAGDRNGNGWWSIYPIDLIGKANAASKTAETIVFPDMPDQTLGIYINSLGLRRMAADLTGQYAWIAASFTDAYIARVDINSNEVRMIAVPDGIQPYQPAVDREGNVWFCSWMTDKLVRYNPHTSHWTFFELPSHGTEIRHMSVLERDGEPEMIVAAEGRLRKILTMTLNE